MRRPCSHYSYATWCLPTAKQLRTTLKRSCPIKPVRACASTLGLISVLLVVLQLIDALGDEEIEQTLDD